MFGHGFVTIMERIDWDYYEYGGIPGFCMMEFLGRFSVMV